MTPMTRDQDRDQGWKQGWKRLIYTEAPSDRGNMRRVLNSLVLHLHPVRVPARAIRFTYTWGLGGISTLLCLLLAITGVLLMFRYEPDIERAYLSIQALEAEVAFGSLIRGVHHWSANLLVITIFLHLLRVFFTGGFKAGRTTNWIIGVVLLVVVLAFNFTGYLLPWYQLSYWAVTVSTAIMRYVPGLGTEVAKGLLGGHEVGAATLRNFYALHVAVLPAGMLALLGYHFWRIRKDGGISQPLTHPEGGDVRVTTIPHLVRREAAVAAVVLTAIVAFSMLVTAPLGPVADPLHSPNPAKAAWYFGGLQELLLHMETEAALVLLAIVGAAVVLVPVLDRDRATIGVYFRSARGRAAALLGAVAGLNLTPLAILADELWIDWSALMPGAPTWVSHGFVPLAVVLIAFCAVALAARWLLKATYGESIVAVGAFLVAALLVMTITCALFRGENMDLVWPGGL